MNFQPQNNENTLTQSADRDRQQKQDCPSAQDRPRHHGRGYGAGYAGQPGRHHPNADQHCPWLWRWQGRKLRLRPRRSLAPAAGREHRFLPCSIRWTTTTIWAASTTNPTQSMESTVITESIINGATKKRKNERIYGLSCALRLGKDASFSRLLHEETDGEGTFFCKEVWSFCLFVQKNLRIKGQSVKLKKRTCMVNLRGCTNEDTGRR